MQQMRMGSSAGGPTPECSTARSPQDRSQGLAGLPEGLADLSEGLKTISPGKNENS